MDLPPIITPEAIRGFCSSFPDDAIDIEVVPETGSTNLDLIERLASGNVLSGRPMLRVAIKQTAGRGRAGRTWNSDSSGLTFSVAWKFPQPVAALAGLSLAVGVILFETLEELLAASAPRLPCNEVQPPPLKLKWPNDILLGDRKLAGVLIETVSDTQLLREQSWAVIGIGINVQSGADVVITEETPDFSRAALPPIDRNALLGGLIDRLRRELPTFSAQGFLPFASRWNAVHAHVGQQVDIVDRGLVRHSGIAVGVDATGCLLLEVESGLEGQKEKLVVIAGDVSLRPVAGGHDATAD